MQNEKNFSLIILSLNYFHGISSIYAKTIRNIQIDQKYKFCGFLRLMVLHNNMIRLIVPLLGGATFLAFTALVIYEVAFKNNQQPLQFTAVHNSNYNFHVYCPIDTQVARDYYSKYIENSQISSHLYVVFTKAQNFSTVKYDSRSKKYFSTKQLQLYYCGWARQWTGKCENAKHICTSPGPMFYLPLGQEATIVWINNMETKGKQWDSQTCFRNPAPEICEIDAKIIDKDRPQTQGCTFYEVTNLSYPTRKIKIDSAHFPISPHIHGLEIRPAFDGNPYAWFNNNGDKGPGYFSLPDSTEYFSQFSTSVVSDIHFLTKGNNMKVIKVANKQSAGTLFYHDHAMKNTKFNVRHGLAGMYIIYNQKIEQQFPKGMQQKYFVLSPANDGDIRNKSIQSINSTIFQQIQNSEIDTFSRNMTYRFRILNGHWDLYYINLSFGIYSETVKLSNHKQVKQQLNPHTKSFYPTEHFTKINFTIIGTDSKLFHQPVHNISEFNLGNGERIDILIKFDEQDGVPHHFKKVYLICNDSLVDQYVIKHEFLINQLRIQNKYKRPADVHSLDLLFYNLSTIPDSGIALKRMRSLFSIPSELEYEINGHLMMNMSEVQKPKIGTVQDWYFINCNKKPHPMHLHLVNFQVTQTFSLKLLPEGCTLYEVDFFRKANYSKFANFTSDADLCKGIYNLTKEESIEMFMFLSNYSLETDIQQSNIGKITGLNVLQQIVTSKDKQQYGQFKNCSLNGAYKYICENKTNGIPSWYKRWKDTVQVMQFQVTVIRVRWADINYDEKKLDYPYFDFASEDELIQFPGFLYHCHRLQHEDVQMMRSFNLMPSDKYLQNKSNLLNNHLNTHKSFHNIQKVKQNTENIWFEKARYINNLLKCPYQLEQAI